MENKRGFSTNAPNKPEFTVENGNRYPNLRHIPGDSVDSHSVIKSANQYLAGKELGQQNENN